MGTLKELLAKPDSVRITAPVLPRETLEQVLAIIRRDIASGEVRVDNPTQNLESYFLDVVAKARAAHETSGAQSGAQVAAYLRAGVEAPPATDKLLEKLSLPQAPVAVAVVKAETGPAVDDRKLAALARPVTAAPTANPTPAAATPAVKPADLAQADEKLSSLLGGKK